MKRKHKQISRTITLLFALALVLVMPPASMALKVEVGDPKVTIVDGGAGDGDGVVNGSITFAPIAFVGYTVAGTVREAIAAGAFARLTVTDCIVTRVPGGPAQVVVPMYAESVFPAIGPPAQARARIKGTFVDPLPIQGNVAVDMTANTSAGPINGVLGPFVGPAPFAGATPWVAQGAAVTRLDMLFAFSLEDIADAVNLPGSAIAEVVSDEDSTAEIEYRDIVLGDSGYVIKDESQGSLPANSAGNYLVLRSPFDYPMTAAIYQFCSPSWWDCGYMTHSVIEPYGAWAYKLPEEARIIAIQKGARDPEDMVYPYMVPSLSEWGLMALAFMLAVSGMWVYWRRKKAHVPVR